MRERRFKKIRSPRRVILVICEGETEERYVEILKRHYRLPITIKSKVVGNKITPGLISRIRKELQLENDNDCTTVYLYDGDVKEIVNKLKVLKGLQILSNPSIELWFLYHTTGLNRHTTSREVLKLLQDSAMEWKTYEKGTFSISQESLLLKNIETACKRAKESAWPDNPSTNMHRFIELLEGEGKS